MRYRVWIEMRSRGSTCDFIPVPYEVEAPTKAEAISTAKAKLLSEDLPAAEIRDVWVDDASNQCKLATPQGTHYPAGEGAP